MKRSAIAAIRARGRALTARQLWVLRRMAEADAVDPGGDGGELVVEGREVWLGGERLAPRTATALLRACAIRLEQDCQFGRGVGYRISGTGREILARAGHR